MNFQYTLTGIIVSVVIGFILAIVFQLVNDRRNRLKRQMEIALEQQRKEEVADKARADRLDAAFSAIFTNLLKEDVVTYDPAWGDVSSHMYHAMEDRGPEMQESEVLATIISEEVTGYWGWTECLLVGVNSEYNVAYLRIPRQGLQPFVRVEVPYELSTSGKYDMEYWVNFLEKTVDVYDRNKQARLQTAD